MELTGNLILGNCCPRGGGYGFYADEPSQDCPLAPEFFAADAADVDRACQLVEQAFDAYRALPLSTRADFLTRIGENILALGECLIIRAMQETGLPRGRIEGERARTVGQLAMFAAVVRQGEFLQAIVEEALPERKPLPRPDLRQCHIPLGPVAVFGASNFPLAFSVAGGDSASALAAGCPIVVKAHPSHPGTSELVGRAIQQAAQQLALPEGVFSLLHGGGHEVGEQLVTHPLIQAVGFTGSRAGGLALLALAQRRTVPVPFYAEMSSINPQILLPAALANRSTELATRFVDSLTLGVGQFCTSPGLVLALEGKTLTQFCQHLTATLAKAPAATMLSRGIWQAWRDKAAGLAAVDGVSLLAQGQPAQSANQGQASVLYTDGAHFLAEPRLSEEVFGPTSLVVGFDDDAQLQQAIRALEGQLTLTLHVDEADHPLAQTLLPTLERRAGRLLVNGFPTGVDVGYAMVHGGPFPATSDARSTSVGASAIARFLRPVCYQDFPDALLPAALRQEAAIPVQRY
ncbi:aldehyde dehydrogenase (NADP(+)) [Sodalis endosymbiont of Spalangia cameroni]